MSDKKKLSRAEQIERFVKANAVTQDKGVLGHAQDVGLSLLSGAVSVPETAVGLADILSGGKAGKFLENQDGAVGFRPKEAKEAISSWKTERGQKQLQDFQEAEGIGAKFGQAVRNPTLVTNTVLESLPAMGAGGVVGRGLGVAAKGISPVVAGAVGEGVVGAGMAAEAIRQQTDDGLLTPKQAGLAAATGVTTAGFGYGGGKIAQKLGLGDVDTMIVGGTRNASGRAGAEGAQEATNKGLVRRTLEAAATEGFLEELPQSVSEQVLQNIALENDIMDGVDEAAVLGVLSGGLMGGIAGAGTRRQAPIDDTPPPPTTDVSVRDEPPQGPTGPTEPAGIDNLNRNFYDQGRGPDNQGMRDVTPTAEPKDVPTDPLSAAANTAQNTDIPQLGFYGDRARDTAATDNAPVEPTPAEKMGLDETQGGLTAAAAKAVNSGVSAPIDNTASNADTTASNADTTASNESTRSAADKRAGELRANAPYKMNQAEAIANNEAYGKDYLARQQAEAAATTGEQGAVKLTDKNPVINIPAPKTKALENNDLTTTPPAQNTPAATDRVAANTAIATGKDGTAKWFGREDKAQEFIAKKNISDTHEVVSAGKSRFEIQPKAQTTGPTAETSAVQNQTSAPKRSEARNTPVKDEAKSIGKAYTADNDEVPYQWDVVDAKDLVSSHTNTFGKNPDFPADAQPRDRANAGYQAQVLDIINKFNPEFLGESALASAGSPIIGSKDNVVESGNGRTIAIRTKYENGSGEPYRQFVQSQAEKFGLDPETIASMSEPVLVRRNLSDMDRGEFAVRANKDDKAAMGSTEIARIDAKAIPNTDLIEFDKNGSMNLNASRKFTQAFTKAVGTNEAGNLIDKDGNISQTGKLRITGALLHNAYDSDKLTRAVTETLDPSAQNVLKVLTDKSPQLNKIKQHIESGKRTSSTLAEDIKTAAEKYIDLVESGANIDLFLANNDLFSEDAISEQAAEIIGDFYDNPRSAVKIGQAIQARIDADTQANDPNAAGLFGAEDAPAVQTPNNKKRSILRSKNKPQEVSNNEQPAPAATNVQTDPTGDTQEQGTSDAASNANGKPAESKQPKTLGAGKEKRTFIGKNAAGEMIYEDGNGIRSKRRGEFMASEPVKIQLGNDEKPFDTSNRPDDFKLERELAPTNKAEPIEAAEVIEDTPAEAKTAEPTSAKAKKEKERFANNSFTNKEEAERRIARIKSKMGTLNSGIDPEMLADGAYVAVAFIEDGILAFKDFAKAMTDTLGNDITPYLSSFWEGARRYPGFTGAAGMTSVAESDAQFAQLMLEYKPSKDMESVLGEDKTQVKPKRKVTKPTNKDVMLRQDWGVNHIDGYVESDEFKGEQTDYGVSGGVKDAFLKDAKNYLTATKKHLESLGYTMALDRKGKPLKVNVNAAGPAVSGDVSLSMYKDGSNIHVSIGQSSVPMLSMFRDMNADGTPVNNTPHPQQVAVMYRTSMDDGDTYATKIGKGSGNIWLSHKLTATELAQDIDKTSNNIAAKVNKLKDANYGVSSIDDRSDADDIVAELLSMESTGATSNDTSTDSADKTRTADVREPGSPTQQRNAQDDTGNVEAREPENDSAATQGRNTGRSIVRGARENVADNGSVPGQRNAADGREGTSGARAPNAGTGERATTDAGTRSPAATKASATDLLIENPLEVVGGTPVQRFNRNREALELMQKLEQEARQATPAEQRVLAGYIGWGSFGQELFQGSWDNPKYKDNGVWKERGEWLRETLGESAWKSAQRSITNAHYTDPPTVMAMWSMVERMGFTGGRVLEPSMGTGNFFSMMPASVQARSQLTGIELDEATGAIAKQLFPQSNIQIMGYQDSKTPDNFYDVVIGNYPFENTPVADRRYNKLNPMLHDYFFLKSMDQVRPGGIVISITSSGTMDKQNTGIRRELAKQAELVAAIRLPSGAFKDYAGTEVVTDIVILRKRAEKSAIVPEDATWIKVADYKTPSGETIKLNQYYIDNPQNIIGTIDFGSGTTKFGAGMIVKRPNNMEQRLKDAINLVPENAIQPAGTTDHLTYYANATGERHGSIFDNDDGDIMLTLGDQIVKAQDVVEYAVKSKKTTDERESEIKAAIDLRRKHSAVVDAERAGDNADADRKALKKAYDTFVKDYGGLRKSYALSYMKRINDPFYFELAALEQDNGKPATMMTKSTTRGKLAMKNPSVRDAYVLARNNSVAPTLKEIAELTGKTESEIKAELQESGAVFEAPNGDMVPSDIYLSGNVRQKLREAQAALADGNKAMAKNIKAIEAVVPKDIPYFNIETQLGATWIPPEAYQDYIAHMLGRTDTSDINVAFLSGRWKVKLEKGVNRISEAVTNYGTHHYPFSSLVQAAFSNQVVRITRRVDGEDVYDGEATAEANERIAKIRGDFGEWLWSDPERRLDLEKEYNEARNAWATPKYDGSFLAFEGMALSLGTGEFNLRQHQADAIWRAIVNRRSLNAHEVGTGKTFTMAGIAIESRRYGIAKKPVIFAHNANSKAVADEIRMMYPSSRVLYIDNLSPKKRDISLRQIANDDWDAIVLPHSLMDRMALTEDTLMAMAADDIAALEQEFREAMDEDGENASKINLDDDESIKKIRSTTAKELAKARKRIIETIKKQSQQSSREGAVTFEDLGIDMILVDEVHEFKKPTIVTRMRMKGLNTATSQRSIQLQLLTRYVRQMNNGGNVHTFTGTPITNTLAEIYHQMRYVMDMEMQEAAVSDWDGWFGSFATEVQDVELSSAGDYEMVTRLAGFVNVPELRQMVGQYMDTVFAEDMPEMQPRKTTSGKTMADDLTEDERVQLLNGRTEGAKDRPYKKVINESADMTAEQKRIFEQVQGYAKEWRDADSKTRRQWLKDGDHRTPLAYGRLADTASFDARLLDPSLVGQEGKAPDNENSKTSRVVKNVKEIYDSHDLAGQVIFMDNGYNTKATRSGGRDEDGEKNPDIIVDIFSPVLDLVERLVQSGIPREQIAVVSGKTSKADRSRIAADMNTGKIRVVIGQTQTLGVGVNMQRNLRAMHHMDAPYMPGELEQRNGRGQRQGNQWNTVLEYRYMTDRLDGKRWQILAVKQRFITAFMKASNDKRSIDGDAVEESNDILESFSEAAGDPRILQRVKLQKKLEQLNSKERLYTRGIADMRREMRSQTNVAANEQASLDKINAKEVADILESQRENFNLVLGNKTYNKRADASDALKTYIKDNVRLGDKSTLIGSYAGTPLYAAFKPMSTEAELVLTLSGYTFNGKGLAGLESVMRNLPKQIEKRIEGINKAKASVETLKKAVTQPFMQKDELARVEKQIEALEADLELNPVPAPVWLRQGAPMDSEVFYDKRPFVVTGHQYSNDGYFVAAEDDKGTVLIPYLEAKDGVGMPLYDEQEFVPPEVIQQKDKDNPNNLTEADRVPDNDDMKFSRTAPRARMTLDQAQAQVLEEMGLTLDDEGMPISDDEDVREEYYDRIEDLLAVGDSSFDEDTAMPQDKAQPDIELQLNVGSQRISNRKPTPNRSGKKAPNGKRSNLNDKQWAEVRTAEFKNWFGDWENDPAKASKVLDENGEPLVVYHGTSGSFTEFDIGKRSDNSGDGGMFGAGFYFSSKKGAREYGKKLVGAYLNIRNPLYNTAEDLEQFREAIGYDEDQEIDISSDLTDDGENAEFFTEDLKSLSYDGVITSKNLLLENIEFVAFDANQIKSSKMNVGSFDSSSNDIRFSQSNPAKGSTKTTPKQVIDKLASKFGKSVIDKLIANGTLEIKTLNDYVVDGELTIPNDVDGIYHQGKAILIADNLSDDMIIPTFLHELGGHGGLQTLMDKEAYAALMRDFDALVKAGDPMAMQAKAMADSVARNKQDALDEYLPYLITLASRAKAKQGKIAGMINRIAMAIRSWLRNTLGMSVKMNAQDVLELAERMVEARTQPPLNNIQSPINSFEGVKAPADQISAVREEQADVIREAPNGKPSNLTEQQWLQVRTPAFKNWFGDWENDPANASKILDENGEPLVLYHGAKSDFWVFDMSRSVPQRNEGMMGMFFTDNPKVAAGYTVDLRKEAAVVKAKDDLSKINNEFGFKRRQLETENKTGDQIQELTKKEFEAMKAAELKLKATIADAFNNAYDNAESRTKAVFVKSQMPFEQDADGKSFLDVNKKAAERYFVVGVYDGIVNNNVLDDANANHSVGAAKVVVSFDATNIKSATDNVGAFSKTNDDIRYSQSNDGMKFSRAAGMNDQFDPRNIAKETAARFHDWVSSAPPGKLSWWHKTVGTMYNLAQRNKFFKPVFDHTEKFINDVSFYAAKASELAPKLLPKLDGLKDITKTAIGAKDNDAISKPIFEGTLLWGRDLNGKAVLIDDWRKKVMATSKQDRLNMLRAANRITPAQEAELAQLNGMQENRFINGIIDDEVSAGLVWTDSELRSKFNLSDEQIKLYREFRAATDNSLDSLTRSDMLRKLGKDANDIEKLVMDASSLRRALFEVEQHINNLSTATPRKAQAYAKTLADIKTSVARTNKLIADGYAPLSRFGQYTVDVVDAAGNREYFGMFESAYDARKMAKEMADLYGEQYVTQGALSSEEFKMFAGVTPETAELFGEMLGLEATGDNAADQAFQEFLRRTKNNRSAMKRLMHRKGIKGYSEDVGRVLASFIYSNARHTSAALNMGNLDRSIQDIPKAEGQLKDAAVKLAQYIKNPQEEGHVIRGFMFAQYLGGSIASAMVNLTQPIAVSFPYLSQFGGAKKAAAELSRAAADWASKKTFSADLQKAINEAEADGTLSPQEVHNLLRQAQGKNPLRAGDGTKYGDAKAAIQNTGSRIGLGWGAFFSLAEQINRRVTFVAAYRMAQDQGMANPAEFASRSIKETQFVYNKASRMQWGRGAVGGTLMTFKTYSVSYIELMHRLWTQGEKGSAERAAGRKAAMIMIATLFLLGGGGGLPFMEDIEDVIDGASQVLGYNLSTRKAREEFLDSVFGEMLGDFMESGISGIPGMPTDVSGRLGMDNLIPGTGVFKQRTSNTKDVLELAGPAGDFVSRVGTGTRSILKGAVAGDARQVGRGALELSPVAVRNAVKGSDMLASGIYKDTKGYKVDDVTPIDAAFKAIGFQPKDISKVQGAAWLSQSGTAYYNLRASEIRSLWAAGISEGNKSKIADAQAALADWNRKNPDQIIVIRPTDIQRRVREMNMNKSDRVTKLAPKTMRAQIQDDFANARGDY